MFLDNTSATTTSFTNLVEPDDSSAGQLRSQRKVNEAQVASVEVAKSVGISTKAVVDLLAKQSCGYENLGFTRVDMKNKLYSKRSHWNLVSNAAARSLNLLVSCALMPCALVPRAQARTRKQGNRLGGPHLRLMLCRLMHCVVLELAGEVADLLARRLCSA